MLLGGARRCEHVTPRFACCLRLRRYSPVRRFSTQAGRSRDAPAPSRPASHLRCTTAELVNAFGQRSSVALAVRILRQTDDPDIAWMVFKHVTDSHTSADVRFYQSMMTYCRRHMPSKAADVLDAAVSRGIHICDAMFCTYLSACHQLSPLPVQDVVDRYAKCGPRSHNVIFGVANICRMSKRTELALHLVSDVVEHDVAVSERLLSIFAACCSEASGVPNAADTADQLLCLMQAKAIPHYDNQQTFGNLVKSLLAQNRVDSAARVPSLMDALSVPPSVRIFNHVLSALSKDGRVPAAMDMFDTMVRRGLLVDYPVLGTLIVACGRALLVAYVEVLHQYAIRTGLADNNIVVCALVTAYDLCSDIGSAETVFASMQSAPDVATFSSMIAAFYHHGLLSKAVETIEQFWASGLTPTAETYNIIISVLVEADRVPLALSTFQEVVRHGVRIGAPATTLFTSACGKRLDLSTVQTLHDYAERNALLDNDSVASALISAYGRCDKLDVAERLSHERRRPSLATFNAMMSVYYHRGLMQNVVSAFDRLQDAGLSPCVVSFNIAISALAKHGDLDEAMNLFKTMVQRDLHPEAPLFRLLVTACGRASQLSAVQTLHAYADTTALVLDDTVTSAVISAFSHCGSLRQAEHAFLCRLCNRSAPTPDVVTYNAMIAAYSHHGRLAKAMATFHSLKTAGLRPTPATLASLLVGCSRAGDSTQAETILSEFNDVWHIPISSMNACGAQPGNVPDSEQDDSVEPADDTRSRVLSLLHSLNRQG
ncbi:hypothetical protein PBRA_000736 [Plasmodiophora brassicae]|uniref:PROP1-like PPR domain-containing protein n=1 Tax=Plasmodiophora brassicae TaxID=37360 RepID=A0A0G4IQI5_PLABS|nr:hypothetical protein PBRA_000736 [Plasmodiophora brassicae]